MSIRIVHVDAEDKINYLVDSDTFKNFIFVSDFFLSYCT